MTLSHNTCVWAPNSDGHFFGEDAGDGVVLLDPLSFLSVYRLYGSLVDGVGQEGYVNTSC